MGQQQHNKGDIVTVDVHADGWAGRTTRKTMVITHLPGDNHDTLAERFEYRGVDDEGVAWYFRQGSVVGDPS